MAFLPICLALLAFVHMRVVDCKASGTDVSSPSDPDAATAANLLTTAHYLDMRERLDHVDDKISDTDKHLTRELTEISGKFALLDEQLESLQLAIKLENAELRLKFALLEDQMEKLHLAIKLENADLRLELKDQFTSFLNQLKGIRVPDSTDESIPPRSETNSSLMSETCPAWSRDRLDNVTSKIDKVDGALEALQSAASRLDDKLYSLTQKSDVCVQTLLDMRNESRAEDDKDNPQGAAHSDWITVLRRMDGRVNFTRGWNDYKAGFGDLRGEFWLGLEFIHQLTAVRAYRMRVVLTDFSGEVKLAEYARFYIRGEADNYQLHVSGYVAGSTAGDAMDYHNDMDFSTYDRDNDISGGNCAEIYIGGWWYKSCYRAKLTGLYQGVGVKDTKGVRWVHAYNDHRSFKRAEMSIRPYV